MLFTKNDFSFEDSNSLEFDSPSPPPSESVHSNPWNPSDWQLLKQQADEQLDLLDSHLGKFDGNDILGHKDHQSFTPVSASDDDQFSDFNPVFDPNSMFNSYPSSPLDQTPLDIIFGESSCNSSSSNNSGRGQNSEKTSKKRRAERSMDRGQKKKRLKNNKKKKREKVDSNLARMILQSGLISANYTVKQQNNHLANRIREFVFKDSRFDLLSQCRGDGQLWIQSIANHFCTTPNLVFDALAVEYRPTNVDSRARTLQSSEPVVLTSNNKNCPRTIKQQSKKEGEGSDNAINKIRTVTMEHPSLDLSTPFSMIVLVYASENVFKKSKNLPREIECESGSWKLIDTRNSRTEVNAAHLQRQDSEEEQESRGRKFSLRLHNISPRDHGYKAGRAGFQILVPLIRLDDSQNSQPAHVCLNRTSFNFTC